MTISISGRCNQTGQLGIAIASSSMSVAARCAYARAGAGVCATQNITDPRLGPRALALMELGLDADTILAGIRANTEHIEFRQLGVLDHSGRTACYSGLHSLGTFASAHGQDVIALGNLLANAEVPKRMMSAFNENADAELGDRLITAMQAGLAAGGEAGPMLSAGMIIVDRVPWPIADIRVDLHDEPITRLSELWKAWRPQMDDYVTRALKPSAAPKFGVPGDL
ncbi:DUF1028 domain-containing protein [Bradyrhizobium rifense]|uniref:DUF1028 domain-containing protein n=1 Tax=Bradyrhizobium rifense TaxID=515499 RepID=A0A5D3KLL8_9BRAD|nr:DUF1028 domain-containing protein [Bradyrhizobium rifense]TYL98834.1 DUF1028 domain-containing protein [Bradyrhizobium rifense]